MTNWWRQLTGIQKTATQTVAVVVMMSALAWASVPLYALFCRVTGYGGTPSVATHSNAISDQLIQVRFDASVERDFPWEFTPVERSMELRLGEVGIAFYEAYNPTDEVIAGSASYNVVPYTAGSFFTKIDCFCFSMQVLQPGERVLMPVTFFVDPDLLDDSDASDIHTITLSYTFHTADVPSDYVALPAEAVPLTQ
jgi:cytochrome c oxidase assembly protein subunit 11